MQERLPAICVTRARRLFLRQLPDLSGGRFELGFVRRRFTDWLQGVAGAVLAGADLEGAVLVS